MAQHNEANNNPVLPEDSSVTTATKVLPLDPDGEGNIFRIGLWGPRNTGKTTMLAMLYFEVLDTPGYDIELLDYDNGKTSAWFMKRGRHIHELRQFGSRTPAKPENFRTIKFKISGSATEQGSQSGFLRSSFLKPARARKSHETSRLQEVLTIEFTDVAGEWFSNYRKQLQMYEKQLDETANSSRKNPIKKLAECHGAIFMVDIEALMRYSKQGENSGYSHEVNGTNSEVQQTEDLDEDDEMEEEALFANLHPGDLLRHYLEDLRSTLSASKLGLPPRIAWCLTKIDLAWNRREDPESLARELLPRTTWNLITSMSQRTNFRWFAVSNVGMMKDDFGNELPVVLEDGKNLSSDAAAVIPYNLLAPIQWLISDRT